MEFGFEMFCLKKPVLEGKTDWLITAMKYNMFAQNICVSHTVRNDVKPISTVMFGSIS